MACAERWLTNREYIAGFNRRGMQLRVPLSGSLDLTHRCNLRCVHCYLGGQSERCKLQDREMDTRQILSVVDEIAEAGCLFLLITGGEPLLREDFPDIYSHIKRKGLLVTVFTNGTVITDRILALFQALPPHVVEISLYGATSQTYERITGISGSYRRCLDGVKRLLEGKVRVRLKTILMTLNRHEFVDIENMARAFGVKFRFDAAIFPCVNGDKRPLNLRVAPSEAIEKEFSDKERARSWKDYNENRHGRSAPGRLYHCGAGLTGFHVDAYGTLKPCLMSANIAFTFQEALFCRGGTALYPL